MSPRHQWSDSPPTKLKDKELRMKTTTLAKIKRPSKRWDLPQRLINSSVATTSTMWYRQVAAQEKIKIILAKEDKMVDLLTTWVASNKLDTSRTPASRWLGRDLHLSSIILNMEATQDTCNKRIPTLRCSTRHQVRREAVISIDFV